MPRNYVRKRQFPYCADLKTALYLVRDENLTVNVASDEYPIPAPTLYSCSSDLYGDGKPDGQTICSNEEEKFLIYVIHKVQE